MQLLLLVCIYIPLYHAILNYFKPIDYNDREEGRMNYYSAGER